MRMINEIVTLPDSCSNLLPLTAFHLGVISTDTCTTALVLLPHKQENGKVLCCPQGLSCRNPTGKLNTVSRLAAGSSDSALSSTGSHREVTQVQQLALARGFFPLCQTAIILS